jgi:hypothetical protein
MYETRWLLIWEESYSGWKVVRKEKVFSTHKALRDFVNYISEKDWFQQIVSIDEIPVRRFS